MIIDIHAHPVLLDVINEDPEDLSFRKQQFGVFKSGRNPIEFEKLLIDDARIDKVVWLPEDYSTQMGRPIVSNEEMEKIVASCPERFIGFASIDPRDPKAKEKLTYAFETPLPNQDVSDYSQDQKILLYHFFVYLPTCDLNVP